MHKISLSTLSAILLLAGCQYLPFGKPEATPIFVGEPESIIVEPPDGAPNIFYRWNILDLPDESLLIPNFSSSSNVFTFTPDVEGSYAFSVIIESMGEEVDESVYYYVATEDTSLVPMQQTMTAEEAAEAMGVNTAPPPETMATETAPPTSAPASSAPSSMPAPAMPSTRVDIIPGHYTVQVSSWQTARAAQTAMQELVDQGYDAYIQRVWLADRSQAWWRVRTGDFTDLAAAKQVRDSLAPRFSGAWVDNLRVEAVDSDM